MADYIERQALRNAHIYLNEEGVAVIDVEDVPAADVVSKAAYDQVAWERHLAEVQLKSIGKSLGEKMDDVQPMVKAKWEVCGMFDDIGRCSNCNYMFPSDTAMTEFYFCPNCGAKMDLLN